MARADGVLLPTEPTPTRGTLVYLGSSEDRSSRLMYLQSLKSGVLDAIGGEHSFLAEAYHGNLEASVTDLAAATSGHRFDIIVAPPSTRPDLYAPYLRAILAVHPEARDLSSYFSRTGVIRSGTTRSTDALASSFSFSPPDDMPALDDAHLLFVDDVFAGGHTAAVVVQTIAAWMGVPLRVVVACPLWVTGRL